MRPLLYDIMQRLHCFCVQKIYCWRESTGNTSLVCFSELFTHILLKCLVHGNSYSSPFRRPIRSRLKPKFSASPMDFQLHFAGLFSCLWPNDGKVITFYDHVFGSGRRPSDLRSFSELTICVYFCHKESHSERFCSLLALFQTMV